MVKRRQISTAAVALLTAGLAACGSTSPATNGSSSPKVTLNVWLMSGSAPASLVTAWDNQFERAHPNVTVKVSLQSWTGIVTKTDTALATHTSSSPDVLEMGNTYVASFAATGGLADLSGVTFENQSTWLQSLTEAGTYNSKLYGVPYYGGDRIAIYNTNMFAKAGIAAPPTTTTDLLSDCAKIKASEPSGTSCIYTGGETWYTMFAFLFGQPGNGTSAIATESGGKWSAQFSSSADQTALSWIYTNLFQTGYDLAPTTQDDSVTIANAVFDASKAAIIVEPGYEYSSVYGTGTTFTASDVGSFALPRYPTSSAPMPTFLGGSNLGVAQKSPNQKLADEYIQLVEGTQYESEMATVGGVIPNSTSLLNLQAENPPLNTAAQAAKTSWFTPNSPQEATVEDDNIYADLLGAIFSGQQTASAAAATYDSQLNSVLNGS
jgi:N,N'-diacetylchitobiose transport system substrate-binding protein